MCILTKVYTLKKHIYYHHLKPFVLHRFLKKKILYCRYSICYSILLKTWLHEHDINSSEFNENHSQCRNNTKTIVNKNIVLALLETQSLNISRAKLMFFQIFTSSFSKYLENYIYFTNNMSGNPEICIFRMSKKPTNSMYSMQPSADRWPNSCAPRATAYSGACCASRRSSRAATCSAWSSGRRCTSWSSSSMRTAASAWTRRWCCRRWVSVPRPRVDVRCLVAQRDRESGLLCRVCVRCLCAINVNVGSISSLSRCVLCPLCVIDHLLARVSWCA